ncbi:MAG: ABC transporter ATP-binding protein [Verrucomicrobia bacterium]|nr:ABC transporter ATP-binding protein [Verrucomicrobiota bacterium]MCF7708499.1 ABC transporter ATP-binding protein [Verrucomicrobiota bacterium]
MQCGVDKQILKQRDTHSADGRDLGCPVLEAQNVHKTYTLGRKPVEVLRGVNLEIRAGEFLAIQGASGAGKSTLLHLFGGLDRPSAGKVMFMGRDLTALSNSDLAGFRNRRVGFVFQAYHLLPELDALENVCLPGRISRRNAMEVKEKAEELLAQVGLRDRMEHRAFELSGGEQQRVAIARALINSPEVIFADEPTGNLDSHTGEEIIELLSSLHSERGATLVIATHDSSVASAAERIVHLLDGVIEAA